MKRTAEPTQNRSHPFENADERAVKIGEYIAENGVTVRCAAAQFSVSKSTVHKDVTTRLRAESPSLYREVEKVLQKNKAERHLRGGKATKEKYEKIAHKAQIQNKP